MGRGIVEPVDDLRATNPPSNGPLLDALADDFRRPRLRPQAPDPDDHDLVRLRPRAPSRTSGTSPTPGTSRGTTASGCGPRSCSTRSPTSPGSPRRSRRRRRGRGRRRSGRTASPRCSSTPSAGPTRTRTRPASGRRDTSVVQALHLMNAPGLDAQDHQRRRPGRPAGRGDAAAREDRRGTVPARLQPAPDRRGAGDRRGRLRRAGRRPSPGDRGPALGPDQLGRVRLQGLTTSHGLAHTNCESTTRRDCLRLGLGALIGGGLVDALRLRGLAAERRPSARGDELHPDLDGRRAEPLRDVRPQARRPRRDPGQVRRRSPPRSPASRSRST